MRMDGKLITKQLLVFFIAFIMTYGFGFMSIKIGTDIINYIGEIPRKAAHPVDWATLLPKWSTTVPWEEYICDKRIVSRWEIGENLASSENGIHIQDVQVQTIQAFTGGAIPKPEFINLQFYPASEHNIQQAEHRLNLTFPPSYRDFLKHSNGWLVQPCEIILPIHQVNLFPKHDPEQFEIIITHMDDPDYETLEDVFNIIPKRHYFDYDNHPPPLVPNSHLSTAIIIGESEDRVVWYALNPQVVFEDGEWEAWAVYSGDGEYVRYRSFGEMMLQQYKVFDN